MMEKPTAGVGWLWVKEGVALFRKQPLELATLFMSYMVLMLAISIIPLVGKLLPLLLVPVFSMSFMQACLNIEQDKRVYPSLLMTAFQSPALPTLLILGVLYLAAGALALGASTLIDGGIFLKAITGQIELDPKTVQESHMTAAMLFAGVVYTPAAMAFWYAAPLAAWQNMGVGKSIFYSFFAVWRCGKAFTVYGLCWAALGVILPSFVGIVIAILTGSLDIARLVLLPISLLMAVVMYCSFYPTYTTVFGRPEPVPEPEPPQD
jgi:hypothetical protein